MESSIAWSEVFVRDLSSAHAALHLSWSAEFVSALKQAHATLSVPNGVDFAHLGQCFDQWRSWAQAKINQYPVPEGDPSRCRVSLFGTMDFGRLETAHTRTLAWLLDPGRQHGFGDCLLVALLRHLAADNRIANLTNVRVDSEVPTNGPSDDERGRLDILATGEWHTAKSASVRWVLVIEAKIDAHEGTGQLAKYEDSLKRRTRGDQPFRVLLTKDGRPPETANEPWHRLSFLDLVKIFRREMSELKKAEGCHFLCYYLAGVLQDIYGWDPVEIDNPTDPYAVVEYMRPMNVAVANET